MSPVPAFWWRWLVVATIGLLLFSLTLMFLPEVTHRLFNLMIFGSARGNPAFGTQAVGYLSFVYAVLGAVMFGWGVMVLLALFGPFRAGEPQAWRLVAWPLAAWFVPDTAISLASGYWQNAVLNLAFAAAFAVPLAATFRAFHPRHR